MITFQYLRRWVRLGACVFAFTYSIASSADMASFATYVTGIDLDFMVVREGLEPSTSAL